MTNLLYESYSLLGEINKWIWIVCACAHGVCSLTMLISMENKADKPSCQAFMIVDGGGTLNKAVKMFLFKEMRF